MEVPQSNIRLIFIFILLLVPPGGCSDSVARLERLPMDAVILAFGDSLTYGTGAKRHESYPAHLEKLINRKVINVGVPGEISAKGLQRLPQTLEKYQPALLILCHGGNDLLRKQDKDQLKENVSEMIKLARRRNIQVLLLGVPEPALFMMESARLYGEIAMALNVPIENDIIPAIESDRSLKSDHIHPNAAGYQKMAEAIATLLTKTGAL